MVKRLISTGSPMEQAAGYSRAVIQDNFAHVAGTTGYDYETMAMPDCVREQTRNCLATISTALQHGGFEMSQVVRANYYVTDANNVAAIFEELGKVFGDTRPAATMIVCGLVDPTMLIEIEVTAQQDI